MITGMYIRELYHRVIGLQKYVRTGILACLKNQFKNHSQINNSVNNQKSKIEKFNLIHTSAVLYAVPVNHQRF